MGASRRWENISHQKRLEIEALQRGGDTVSGVSIQFWPKPLLAKGMGLLPFVVREVAALLAEFPLFAAWYERERIFYYDKIRVGLALDTENGLKVVNLGDPRESKPEQLHERIMDLVLRDMRNELTTEHTERSTFTITDLSALGVLTFEPLINGRQSAVLGIAGDQSAPDQPITLILRFDHRVLTGRQAAQFLNALKARLKLHESL
jgi:pyruvate/2-oxoglutarate dehydrogenase complex dihydrolipoamide acyltransferase (E2) component